MATTSLAPPALVVNQQFSRRPAGLDRPLLPVLFGSLADVIRYSEASEKERGYLGIYDHDPAIVDGEAQTLLPWPSLPVGNVADQEFFKLFVEDGLFRYLDVSAGDAVAPARNKIRDPNYKFRTNGAFTGDLIDGGVLRGDLIRIQGVDTNSDPFTHATYVLDVEGDVIAATVGTAAASPTNVGTLTESSVVTAASGNSSNLTVASDALLYDGRSSGVMDETYTVEVITGGAAGTAVLKVTSQSGTDDVASVTTVTLGQDQDIGARGLVAVFTADQASTFVVGDTWEITARAAYTTPSLAVAGSYTGTADRTYIIEVVDGNDLSSALISITSQDGTDNLALKAATESATALGSYGVTVQFTGATGLVTGDKWTVKATAAKQGNMRTLVLASEMPEDIATNVSSQISYELFRKQSIEIPLKTTVPGGVTYETESTQISLKGGIEIADNSITYNGVPRKRQLITASEFSGTNKLYAEYRSWYPTGSGLVTIGGREDIDVVFDGPNDLSNPLKYGVTACRLGATGETIYAFNVGDPSDINNWQAGFTAAAQSNAVYGYVPLTTDQAVLSLCQAAVNSSNSDRDNAYRVMWVASEAVSGGVVLNDALTTDEGQALAVVEDDSAASATQYTQVRFTSGNMDLIELGIRPGDELRFKFVVDAWGDAVYTTKTVSSVRSATTLTVTTPFAAAESIPLKAEIHRTFNATELKEAYKLDAAQYGSDLVRYVLAPEPYIGGELVDPFHVAALIAGMRAFAAPQQPLSTRALPGVSRVGGMETLGFGDLNELAAAGAMICSYDFRALEVRIRHAVTTGETDILAKREESMVSSRHAALFQINARLEPYVGQINLGDDDQFDLLAEQIRSELESVNKELQAQGFTPELGGLIRNLAITRIEASEIMQDELIIEGTLELGRPGNRITFSVLIS